MPFKRVRVQRFARVLLSTFFIIAVLLPFRASAGDAPVIAPSEESQGSHRIFGYISSKYRYRTASSSTGQTSDQDIFVNLRFDAVPKDPTGNEFHFLGAVRGDIDGNRNQKPFYPLEDIGDAYNSWVVGYAYEAHLDINRPLPYLNQVRIGRQAGTRDEAIFFDGIGADIAAGDTMSLTAYGGSAVHFYELDQNWGSDLLAGLGLDYAPARSTGMSLDYLSVHDKRTIDPFTTKNDQLVSFRLRQQLSTYTRLMARYRYLNGESRDVTVRAVDAYPAFDMQLSASYVRQFATLNELSNELSSYYDVMGQSRPYQSIDAKVRKLFGSHFALDLGYFQRSLLKPGDENAFNREYKRYYAVAEMSDVLRKGLAFTITGEYWETGDKQFNSMGFDAGYTFKRLARSAAVHAGTYYSLYKYDYYLLLGERQQVRTYYVQGKLPLSRHYTLSAGYEFEDSIENYQTARMEISYGF